MLFCLCLQIVNQHNNPVLRIYCVCGKKSVWQHRNTKNMLGELSVLVWVTQTTKQEVNN